MFQEEIEAEKMLSEINSLAQNDFENIDASLLLKQLVILFDNRKLQTKF
jgi:hypothetical protein